MDLASCGTHNRNYSEFNSIARFVFRRNLTLLSERHFLKDSQKPLKQTLSSYVLGGNRNAPNAFS